MKWKPDVTQRGSEYIFQYEDESQTVNKEYHYIIDAIELGITDDKKLLNIVMEMEHADEVVAGFCLAAYRGLWTIYF